MSRYAIARTLLGLTAAIGWIAAGGTVLLALLAVRRIGALDAAIGAAPGLVAGAAILALVEMARAQLDTADNTDRMIELLQQIARQGGSASPRPGPLTSDAPPGTLVKTYRGKRILREAQGVSVDEHPFDTVLAAEKWIDRQPIG